MARLSHLGLLVRDLAAMEGFYTGVLGLSVSDRGTSARRGLHMVFLTGEAGVHHQLALVSGKGGGTACPRLEHLAFEVPSLDALRDVRDRAVAAGASIRTSDHGNAWSIYFADPEGNGIEVFAPSPFEVAQPFGRPFELDRPDEAIMADTRRLRG